jgi:hypothetical protein
MPNPILFLNALFSFLKALFGQTACDLRLLDYSTPIPARGNSASRVVAPVISSTPQEIYISHAELRTLGVAASLLI